MIDGNTVNVDADDLAKLSAPVQRLLGAYGYHVADMKSVLPPRRRREAVAA